MSKSVDKKNPKSQNKSLNKQNSNPRSKPKSNGKGQKRDKRDKRDKGDRRDKSKSKGSHSKSKQKINKNDKNEDNNEEENINPNSLLQKSKLQNLNTNQQLELLKQLHNKIIVAPEDNIKHLQTMFSLIKTPNLKVVSTALRVLAETFINVAPLDPIDITKLDERAENRIKKEQYKVVKFEKIIVEQYERYLKMLKEMHGKTKPENFKNEMQIYTEFKKCLLECVIKCYRTLWNFNFSKELNDLCLKFIKYEECRDFLKEMLTDRNVATMSIKLKIIAGIARIVKTEEYQNRLPSDIIKIINTTFIDSRYLKKNQESLTYKKKQLKKRLYREEAFEKKKEKEKYAESGTLEMKRKKREQKAKEKLRVREQVDKQFAEGETNVQNKDVVRFNSQVLQQLFYIYFKILVERVNSIFLKDTLDGILKFVHLINIDLTQSLLQHLDASAAVFRDLWKIRKTSEIIELRMLIVFTGESIINGPLSVYNMDDVKMTRHLFKIIRDLNNKDCKITKEVYRLLCISLDQGFVKRRQLSQQVVGAFNRQIAILLKEKENIPKLYLLEFIRILAYRYGKITKMFQQDNEGFGLNSFNSMVEDPQCSNAINTEIITTLRAIKSKHSKEYQKIVERNVQKLCKHNFVQKDMRQNLENILERQLEEGFF